MLDKEYKMSNIYSLRVQYIKIDNLRYNMLKYQTNNE